MPDGWPSPFKLSQPSIHGPGAGLWISSIRTPAFHRIDSQLLAISCNEAFTPTRSARAPSVASSLRHRNGEPYAARLPPKKEPHEPAKTTPLSRNRPEGRITHPLAKGNAIRRTQDAFHLWTTLKGGDPLRCPPFPARQCLWFRRYGYPTCSPARQRQGPPGNRPHR